MRDNVPKAATNQSGSSSSSQDDDDSISSSNDQSADVEMGIERQIEVPENVIRRFFSNETIV
jgi:hypothetical protein